ncbi:MAG: hypothetical protein KF684_10630 [Phycisphaeraceae bacterium]|nr:hypothetical protein [Phycisphaeraceae bacterium]
MPRVPSRLLLVPSLLACCAAVAACAGSSDSRAQRAARAESRVEFVDDSAISVSAEDYASVFDAARDALRAAGFVIDRVDAAAGVITTEPMGGMEAIKSPLLRQAGGASLHRTAWRARATFSADDKKNPPDLRLDPGTRTLRFEVVELREYRPSRRIDTTSVAYAWDFSDRVLAGRGLEPEYTVTGARNLRAESLLAQKVNAKRP